MDTKCLKKSTMQQLQRLVDYMEENPDLARGTPAFGANKLSAEKQWKSLCESVNALGPPTRTIAEWKKTWADLKSRTKKKISENRKSLQETGGGLYRYNYLTALEQVIDRTLLLSSAGAPSGRVFGDEVEVNSRAPESIEDCFQSLVKTPPRLGKAVAVVTPTGMRSQEHIVEVVCHSLPADCSKNLQQSETQTITTNVPLAIGSTYRNDSEHQLHRPNIVNPATQQQQTKSASKRRPYLNGSDDDEPACSSTKKKKKTVDEQLSLIRRQLRVAETNAATAKEQTDVIKRLANAAEIQAEAAKRRADAAEVQATCMNAILESIQRLEKNFEKLINKQ